MNGTAPVYYGPSSMASGQALQSHCSNPGDILAMGTKNTAIDIAAQEKLQSLLRSQRTGERTALAEPYQGLVRRELLTFGPPKADCRCSGGPEMFRPGRQSTLHKGAAVRNRSRRYADLRMDLHRRVRSRKTRRICWRELGARPCRKKSMPSVFICPWQEYSPAGL